MQPLMSDSLRGIVKDDIVESSKAIVASMAVKPAGREPYVLSGLLRGFANEDDMIKIDVHVDAALSLRVYHDLRVHMNVIVESVSLVSGTDTDVDPLVWLLKCVKIIPEDRGCTLGLDLVRVVQNSDT